MTSIHIIILISLLNISFGICATIPSNKNKPALLVVSYDGFRPDYLNCNDTPNLHKFRENGTSAAFMMNVFPTKTIVNHFTIATGLYAENHGVLSNEMYDMELKKSFKYGYEMFHYKDNTEPIWISNEKAGGHSGCMMWSGSEFFYNGMNCTFTGIFNKSEQLEDRVDTAISWFSHPETPANLVMLYIEQPDEFSHAYGYESPVIKKMVSKLDNLSQYIQDKLIQNGLDKSVNVIHLSDHGMSSVTPPNFINLMDFVANDSCKMFGSSPVVQIVPNDADRGNEVYMNLTKAADRNGHFKIYHKDNIPARWHANNPNRMGPIIAVADIEYAFQDLFEAAKYYERAYNISITNETKYGLHGYDNAEPSMHAMFIAKGPLFSKGKQLNAVNMVDLYNIFCTILNIKCAPNDGSHNLDNWNDMFVRTSQ